MNFLLLQLLMWGMLGSANRITRNNKASFPLGHLLSDQKFDTFFPEKDKKYRRGNFSSETILLNFYNFGSYKYNSWCYCLPMNYLTILVTVDVGSEFPWNIVHLFFTAK